MTRPARSPAAIALLVLVALACWAAPASATFHEVSIREVYAGSALNLESQYVELQMWAPGQNLVKGHTLSTFDKSGKLVETNTFAADVSGEASQSTILLATAPAEFEFGVADKTMAPKQLDPAGGAVCWEEIDCIAWGSFIGSGALPSPAGSPAPAIPDGMALRRTITPGCATLLEPSDDRDNSAADFSPVFPGPRANSVAPSERACGSPIRGGGGGSGGPAGGDGPGGGGAPQTKIKRKPPRKTHDRTPTFRFGADEPGSTFQCKLDRKSFKPCRSPFTTRSLSLGRHIFRVRARGDSGNLDQSPASYAFKVIARR